MNKGSKSLLLILVLLLTWGIASATMVKNVAWIPKANYPPLIDGEMDDVWNNTTEFFCQKFHSQRGDNWLDCFGTWRMLWDKDCIYLFLYYQDDTIVETGSAPYEADGFELLFDADNSKKSAFDSFDDVSIRINHIYQSISDITVGYGSSPMWDPAFSTEGIEFFIKDTEDGFGWILEIMIPLATMKMENHKPGDKFGFEIQMNDNDSDHREHINFWWSGSDNSWKDPSIFGTCMLWNLEIDENLPVIKTIDGFVPAIDGKMDENWVIYPEFNCNTWVIDNIGSLPFDFSKCCDKDWIDHRFRFWLVADDAKLYGFVKMWDDVIIDTHNNSHEKDGFEIYIDGDNSKKESYDKINDTQLRISHWMQNNSDLELNTGDWGAQKEWVDFKVLNTKTGYDIEFSALRDKFQIKDKFGFDIQSNDNDLDKRDSMRRWWGDNNNSWKNARLFGTAVINNYPTAVDDKSYNQVYAQDFRLNQNYPNPFNPVTTITYSIEKNGKVKLIVYNLLGNEIATLVDEVKTAGSHRVTFDARHLSSGIYFYKLFTANRVETLKMTLLK